MQTIDQIISRIRKLPFTYPMLSQSSGVSVDLIKKLMAGSHRNLTYSTAEKLSKGLAVLERRAIKAKK